MKIPNSYVKVPCGVCDECTRKRAKDLFIRARFEAEDTFLNGGCGFMCTLTYDDNVVPTLFHLGKRYMVFNKQDVIDFIKRLRSKLDRFYKYHFSKSAPDFKYLITSEYGTNPFASHRPHYHLIILFRESIPYFNFRKCFESSLVNRKSGERYFGKIYQCDVLDMSRNGIRYSSKYILKDQTYNNQKQIIYDYIKSKTEFVNTKHGIIDLPKSEEDFFHNKCIRSTKQYKRDIDTFVKPYRHMLQFYMCSNDFGCSAICNRYGESLFSLGVLNIDKCSYSIPKAVIQRLERDKGSDKRDTLVKSVFLSNFRQVVNLAITENKIDKSRGETLYRFCEEFVQPRFGCLYFVSPSALSYFEKISCISQNIDFLDTLLYEFRLYDDHDFFKLRNDCIRLIDYANSKRQLDFRMKVAYRKNENDREKYVKLKFNKS